MKLLALALASTALLVAIAAPAQSPTAAPAQTPVAAPAQAPATTAAAPVASLGTEADAINAQPFAVAGNATTRRRVLIKAQVMLDRLHFAPGVIDGAAGSNMRLAVAGFQAANAMPETGKLDAATWNALVAASPEPALRRYTITAEDVAGPMEEAITPGDFGQMAQRKTMGWTSARESLAERAHMDEALLVSLNRGVSLETAGSDLIVAHVPRPALPEVARIEVDKNARSVRAYGTDGKLVAAFPATVGSSERPAPDGALEVVTVAMAPTYTFDPKRLTFKTKGGTTGKLVVPAGPNNPVGAIWIDLSKDTYGIHGAPDPRLVGKVASHGCVRLTNWDAAALAKAVKPGTKVDFSGTARS